jgi:hypothetical protein
VIEEVVAMTQVYSTPTHQPRSVVPSWLVLTLGSLVAFLLGAAAQVGAYVAYDLCIEADEADCVPGTVPTTAEWVVATVPSYLIWISPAALAAFLGYRALRSGNPGGRVVMVVAAAVVVLVTVGCTLMWWV